MTFHGGYKAESARVAGGEKVLVARNERGETLEARGEEILVAAGRAPTAGSLGLENAGVELEKKGLRSLGEWYGQLPPLGRRHGAGRGRGDARLRAAGFGSRPHPSERPTGPEYDRFIWLVEVIKRTGCDDAVRYDTSRFLVKDVLTSAILVRANEALLEIAEVAGASDEDRATIRAWIERVRQGLD